MKKLLLVDADPLSLCVLDVSLRKLGFSVATSGDAADALAKVLALPPDLVLTDTRLPGADGLSFVRRLKERLETADIPVIILASVESADDRKRALELGVDDYLAKPIFLSELTARIHLLLARRTRDNVSAKVGRTRFAGSTQDLALVDLLQNFAFWRKSGALHLRHGEQEAHVYFRDGKVVDAELGATRGEEAVYRALLWSEASFEVEFKAISNEDVIGCSTQSLVMKGMQRVDEWVRLCEQVEPLAALFEISPAQLLDRLSRVGELPAGLDAMLHLPPRSDVVRALPPQSARAAAVASSPSADAPAPAPAPTAAPAPQAAPVAAVREIPASASASSAPSPASCAPASPAGASPALRVALAPPPPGRDAAALATSASAAPSSAPAPAAAPRSAVATAQPASAPGRSRSSSAPSPSQRPSAAPWTREVGASVPPVDVDEVAAGVPRAWSAPAKAAVWGTAALAAAAVVAFGLQSVRARQMHEAEAARGPNTVAAASSAVVTPPEAPAPSPSEEGTEAPAESASAAAAIEESTDAGAAQPSAALAPPPAAGAPAAAANQAGPTAPASRETALDTSVHLTNQSPLIRDAERALLKGETDHAITFAQQAVSENPADADAWLTLAAAKKAAGDLSGARDAYQSCVEQAQNASVNHCRVMGRVTGDTPTL